MPQRRILSRLAGSRLPDNCVSVARPHKYGNPFKIDGVTIPDAQAAVRRFELMLADPDSRHKIGYPSDQQIINDLRGKDLACFCRLDQPCHADVLLQIANLPIPEVRKPLYAHCVDCGYEWAAAFEIPDEDKKKRAFSANTCFCPYCGETNIKPGVDPNSPKIT